MSSFRSVYFQGTAFFPLYIPRYTHCLASFRCSSNAVIAAPLFERSIFLSSPSFFSTEYRQEKREHFEAVFHDKGKHATLDDSIITNEHNVHLM